MRKFLILLFLGLLIFPFASYAGIYGVLKGKVVDDAGNPVIGASIRVIGTKLGAVAKSDGRFTVVSIPSGTYTIRITSVGYNTYETSVKISADEISEISPVLKSSQGTVTETLIVSGKKEMVSHMEIGQKTKYDSQTLDGIAREGVTAIVGLTAGVFNSGDGYVIRGSRTSETQIRVDGLDVTNQFTGGTSYSGLTYYPMVSQYATEEIQVNTGGFSAEYGDASGGIVNSVTKTGRTDKYEGVLRWRTDVAPLWGSQPYPVKLERIGDRLQAFDDSSKSGQKYLGSDEHKIDYGFGGPLPGLDKSTFFISGVYNYEKYRNNTLDVKDPAGNSLGQIADNQTWVKNITGRIKLSITNDIDLTLGANWGMSNFETNSWGWMYNTDKGVNDYANWAQFYNQYGTVNTTNVPEYVAKSPVINQLVASEMVRINHRLSSNSFYEFTLSRNTNNDELSKRNDFNSPSFFNGFSLWVPQDNFAIVNDQFLPGHDKAIDEYSPLSKAKYYSADKYSQQSYMVINPLTGYYEGSAGTLGTNNPYGIQQLFNAHGDSYFDFRYCTYWQADGSYTTSIDGQFQHLIKTGFETRFYTLERHYNSLPWDANPFFDVYSDRFGGNLYADNDTVNSLTNHSYNPWRFSVYLQDQIKYKGIVISPGVRFDYFEPSLKHRVQNDNQFIPINDYNTDLFAATSSKHQLSPRINVTYPITERSNIMIAYGLYFQMPQLQYMYDGFSIAQLRGNQILGNPDMKAQRTNQYQLSYNNQITDEFAIDFAAYYKDIYNQVGLIYVPSVPMPYYQYAVSEYGNARGLEVTLRKRPVDHFSFDLNYNLSYAIGTSSGVTDNYLKPIDPYTGTPAFPLSEFPAGTDRRHRINLNLVFFWGNNEGPSIGGINPIENSQISFTTFYQTGTPYTRQDIAGADIGEYNGERFPSYTSTDMRISKAFLLRDLFGDGAKQSQIELFLAISNLFNFTGAVAVNSRTGDPIDNGVAFRKHQSDFGLTPYYKEANFSRAETINPNQYDQFGQRYYSSYADFDNNGVVTQEEKFRSYINFQSDAANLRGNFSKPRTVYFGLMFRF